MRIIFPPEKRISIIKNGEEAYIALSKQSSFRAYSGPELETGNK